ncbi:2062_t:CDS:2 [Funneliformis geosporum]|nr:2062_t:CDS:2 [Funneliformis geosporum]
MGYLDLLKLIVKNGEVRADRTEVGTKALFGCQMRFNLREGFPLLTTKKKYKNSPKYQGENLKEFDEKIKTDNNFAQKYGELGPVYAQFFVSENKELTCLLYQRSGDMFLGVPFNIASYSLLTSLLAQVCGYKLGEFIHVIGDAHIYSNHLEQVKLQLERKPRKIPTLKLNPERKSIFDFCFEDINLENYEPYPPIKAKVAVTERFGQVFYKLIFEKLGENELNELEAKIIDKREGDKIVIGDILEISVDLEKTNRFGREEEYFHLLDFKIDKLVKVEQLKQEIFSLIGEIGNTEEKLSIEVVQSIGVPSPMP